MKNEVRIEILQDEVGSKSQENGYIDSLMLLELDTSYLENGNLSSERSKRE